MKHLKTFENFVNEDITNEIWGQKFFTGHPDSGSKEAAKQKILSDINTEIDKMNSDPESYGLGQTHDTEMLKNDLITQAKDNNWKGSIEERPSAKDGLIYITYNPGKSTFQQAVQPSSGGTRNLAAY